MNGYMIPRSAFPCKSEAESYPETDLICPQPDCRSGCYFSSAAQRIWCPQCGWAYNLSAEQARELAEAVAGITDLPIAQYLLILASDGTATNTAPEEQLWIADGGQA